MRRSEVTSDLELYKEHQHRLAAEAELQETLEILAAAVPGGDKMSLREVAHAAADLVRRYQWHDGRPGAGCE